MPRRVASSIRQSNGLLIRRFRVRFPGDPPPVFPGQHPFWSLAFVAEIAQRHDFDTRAIDFSHAICAGLAHPLRSIEHEILEETLRLHEAADLCDATIREQHSLKVPCLPDGHHVAVLVPSNVLTGNRGSAIYGVGGDLVLRLSF